MSTSEKPDGVPIEIREHGSDGPWRTIYVNAIREFWFDEHGNARGYGHPAIRIQGVWYDYRLPTSEIVRSHSSKA